MTTQFKQIIEYLRSIRVSTPFQNLWRDLDTIVLNKHEVLKQRVQKHSLEGHLKNVAVNRRN